MTNADASNPPPLISPVSAFNVRAVLDQDAHVSAGLAVDASGRRVVMLIGTERARRGEREEFMEWTRALVSVGAVARVSKIAGYGHTDDGRPFLATYVDRSLADMLRKVGPPESRYVRKIGSTVADALAATHSYGLVHGAVSPATVLLVDDGVRLGGFGATAPGLSTPLGVWAFTAPEHRAAARAGRAVGSPAGDVFALAATICVAYAGSLPWSDPVSWADAAGILDGPNAPAWALAIRAALDTDPDRRPTAEDLATALREPLTAPAGTLPTDTVAREPGTAGAGVKVDLRGLIPRQVRRLAAYSVNAMADGTTQVVGRAAPGEIDPRGVPAEPAPAEADAPATGIVAKIRKHKALTGTLAALVALVTAGVVYASTGNASDPRPPSPAVSGAPVDKVALLEGARETAQAFLHDIGVGSDLACISVHGSRIITTKLSPGPVTCQGLLEHAREYLGQPALDSLANAQVLQALDYDTGVGGEPGISTNDTDEHAFVSLPYVPSLEPAIGKFEMVLTFKDSRWWIVQVTFG